MINLQRRQNSKDLRMNVPSGQPSITHHLTSPKLSQKQLSSRNSKSNTSSAWVVPVRNANVSIKSQNVGTFPLGITVQSIHPEVAGLVHISKRKDTVSLNNFKMIRHLEYPCFWQTQAQVRGRNVQLCMKVIERTHLQEISARGTAQTLRTSQLGFKKRSRDR